YCQNNIINARGRSNDPKIRGSKNAGQTLSAQSARPNDDGGKRSPSHATLPHFTYSAHGPSSPRNEQKQRRLEVSTRSDCGERAARKFTALTPHPQLHQPSAVFCRAQKNSARPTRNAPPKATSGILSLRSPNRLWRTRRKSALFPHCCRIATFSFPLSMRPYCSL